MALLGWPSFRDAPITSLYGSRNHPVYGTRKWHNGIDLGVPEGSPVLATGNATVRVINADPTVPSGIFVILDHSDGKETSYSHLSEVLVRRGEKVTKGDLIALSGNTGGSTGPHLHWVVRDRAKSLREGGDVDPLNYLRGKFKLRTGGYVKGLAPIGILSVLLAAGAGYLIYKKAKKQKWI
jgi:murein DD-endopeptidase MepM/ murein hydrolase activator NlpD